MSLMHSKRGFRRYMQMSNKRLFAFVEGKDTDPYFYGRLCESVCAAQNVSYEIMPAHRLPWAGAGGKNILLEFVKYLRRIRALSDDFQGKRTTSLFLVDKDIDDLRRKTLRTPHIVYTEYFQVENYLFVHGNLIDAVASAAGMDRMRVADGIVQDWRLSRAEIWKDWVTLCLFSQRRGVRGQVNYGVVSPLNSPPLSATDQGLLQQFLDQVELASGLTRQKFLRAFRRTCRYVDELYASGQHDKIFKGKWYGVLIDAETRQIAGGQPYDNKYLSRRIFSTLATTLNYEAPWSEHFRDRIQQVIR